jgi:hypothetical protein
MTTAGGSSGEVSLSRSTSRPSPREATTPRLGVGQKSPSMEIAALLAETGPEDLSSSSTSSSSKSPPQADHSIANGDPFATVRPAKADAAAVKGKAVEKEVVSGGGRMKSSRLIARSPVNLGQESTDETDGDGEGTNRRRTKSVTLAEAVRDGPPLSSTSTSASNAPSSSTGLGISSGGGGSAGGSSPNTRANKRWTMSGVGSMLLSRPRSTSQSGEPKSPILGRPASARPAQGSSSRTSLDSRQAPPAISWDSAPSDLSHRLAAPSSSFPSTSTSSTPRPTTSTTDYKRRPATSLHRSASDAHSHPPVVPSSSQAPPDAHPASSASPLEYVKLARTKGARLLRATETKRRTYLAVLCGEEGERIELFTVCPLPLVSPFAVIVTSESLTSSPFPRPSQFAYSSPPSLSSPLLLRASFSPAGVEEHLPLPQPHIRSSGNASYGRASNSGG